MADEGPRLAASGIVKGLLAELQNLPTLRSTQSVTIRPYSGPNGLTWELDRSNPRREFADVATVVARLQQQSDLDLSPPPPT